MKMQIQSLAIYNRRGKRRVVKFELGSLNIITGKSLTGKSALISIVDYCLGRSDYIVRGAVITDNVVWYVLHGVLPSGEVIIGRPAPQGAASTTAAYFETGGSLSLPEFADLRANSNTTALERFLTEAVGISGNETIPEEGQSRLPLQANISHARFLLFQPQNTIADHEVLFYRQKEPFIPQSIKDTLPYFLGATGDDQYSRLQEVRRLRRELRLKERRLADEEALRGRENDRALSLLAEARDSGLLGPGDSPSEFDEIVELLRPLQSVRPGTTFEVADTTLESLNNERSDLLGRQRTLQSEIDAARSFVAAQTGFSTEAKVQRDRLSAVDLFSRDENHRCPVCDNDLPESVPKAEQIRSSLEDLDRQIGSATRQRPRLDAFINTREEQIQEIRQQLRANKAAVDGVLAEQSELRRQQDSLLEQARVTGKISLFVESVTAISDDSELRQQIQELQTSIEELEAGLSNEAVEDQLNSRLQIVAADLMAWAKELGLEHSEHPLGFDLRNLTVVAHRPNGPLRLSRMGGGKNAMGYHVCLLLALHKFFCEQDRPVPSLLMLDQPTQVFYPPEPVEDRSVDDLQDDDRANVEALFELIRRVTEKLAPNMQVIVMDHADLQHDWFQNAVVERWRGDEKLVPLDWLESENDDEEPKSDET